MDRRQRKTRTAIFQAFEELLRTKRAEQITVGEIIQRADVGRATFYAHFETKDALLEALCEELFCHIFDGLEGETAHHHIFDCEAPDSVFLHLFQHLAKDDHGILKLFAGENNEIFLGYFKQGLVRLIESQIAADIDLPRDFRVHQIAAFFTETVRWWIYRKMQETPEELYGYFMTALTKPLVTVIL